MLPVIAKVLSAQADNPLQNILLTTIIIVPLPVCTLPDTMLSLLISWLEMHETNVLPLWLQISDTTNHIFLDEHAEMKDQ